MGVLSDEKRKTLGFIRLAIICLIVVSCNKWEFRAMGFDRITHNPILYMMGGWCNEDSNLR